MFREKIREAIQKICGDKNVLLEVPGIETHGDYSTNLAMVLAKREGRNPMEVARGIKERLGKADELTGLIDKIEVAGPGFVNLRLSKRVLLKNLEEIVGQGEKYGKADIGKGKTVVIDYSSPNIAKRFGIGHLRSTIIGQALYNLYSFLGYKVIGDNHLGDWGTQFGTLLYQVASNKPSTRSQAEGLQVTSLNIDKLEKLYVDFNKKAESNPELWDKARSWFKKLEEGDTKARETWKTIVDISMYEFERLYKLLGVKIDYAYGESFYVDKMPTVIEELKNKRLLSESQGAQVVELPGMVPAMIVKSDGATTYLTRDLATIVFRLKAWNPDIFIYEVGSDQILHFRQVFAVAKLMGWNDKRHYVHVAHGLIRFEHGKMSTRRGETIELEDVLNEAVERAKRIIDKSETPRLRASNEPSRVSSGRAGRGLSDKEKEKVAGAVGVGAVKYFDLMHHPTTDIIFDWEKMFVLEGNSAPYLQYTVARTNSVLAKSQIPNSRLRRSFGGQAKSKYLSFEIGALDLNDEELLLLRSLVHFPEVIEAAAKSYSPNLVCNYLFDLAQKFNNFYARHRIIGSKNYELRIMLTDAIGQVLKTGLGILGIETPERM